MLMSRLVRLDAVVCEWIEGSIHMNSSFISTRDVGNTEQSFNAGIRESDVLLS
jgi:hypothetical protein